MKKNKLLIIPALISSSAMALPIDWHGEILFDTHKIENYRRVENTTQNTVGGGSQEISLASGGKSNASFQSYIFKLQPEIIINDSTTVKAEFTTGYGRGGLYGDSNDRNSGTDQTVSLYAHNTVSSNTLNVTQAYATFFADTATYVLGRHTTHWGLGALHNNGEATAKRYATIRDGVTANFKIGNFKLAPYYSKISGGSTLTKASRVNESGISLLYNNKDKDLSFGILYAKNKASNSNGQNDDITGASIDLGKTDVKITDLYFKKSFGNYTLEIEAPLLSGKIGNVYNATDDANYKVKAILIHNSFVANNRHSFGLNLGKVSGDSGNESSFDAMYLNPNYQVANVLFRYNLEAISNLTTNNIHDSYVTNALFLKLSHTYNSGKWHWINSIIWAKAEEAAKGNSQKAFNHTNFSQFTSNFAQEDDLGFELDSNFTYRWNTNVTLGGSFGYLFTGEYYGYTNTATPNKVKDTYALSAFANIKF